MTIKAGPFSQVDGQQTISLGNESHLIWHEIAVRVVDTVTLQSADPTTGVLAGAVLGVGADKLEDFTETLDLTLDERRWKPFASHIQSITITPTDLDADKSYFVTISNWSE